MNELAKENRRDSLGKLAWLLDASIPVPLTRWRIGLDGIIGLIPGVGDVLASTASMWIVLAGVRRGVPLSVVLRMVMNVGLETIIGSIPIIGDLFDFAFRANLRNLALIRQYEENPAKTHKGSRLGMAIAFVFLVLALALIVWLALVLVTLVWDLITG